MSLDSGARPGSKAWTGAVPGQRTPASPGAVLLSPTGEHIGLTPVAQALRQAPPVHRSPAPPGRRLFALCAAAAALGFVGILVGLRGWFGLVMHKAEPWFLPAILILGVFGILTAAGGFLTVHRRQLPWIMVGVSATTLLAAIIVTNQGVA
jgi:hypothetical protein